MATARKRGDDQSLGLFSGEGEAPPPGHTDIQKLASETANAPLVLKQPMQTVALRPTHGAITRQMNLVFLKIIQEIQQQPQQQESYRLPLADIARFIGDTKNYDRLKESLRALNVTQVEFNSVGEASAEWAVSTLLSSARIKKTNATTSFLEVSLAPDLNRGIRELKQFSSLNLLLAAELRTASALNLFRVCVAYETNPSKLTARKPPTEWDELLRGSARKPGAKFVYKYFKRDVIVPAMAEVNKITHLTVELVEHREGKVVTEIQFRVHQKALREIAEGLEDPQNAEMIAQCKAAGLRITDAKQMVASYGIERVRRNLRYMNDLIAQDPAKVKRPAAYLKAAVQGDYAEQALEEPTNIVPTQNGDGALASGTDAAKEVLLQEFQERRRKDANGLFLEMPRRESDQHWDQYVAQRKKENNKTLVGSIETKGLKSKLVQVDFYNWLANQLYGEITETSFLNYLVQREAPRTRARRAKAG